MFETLEARRLLATFVLPAGSTVLTINGSQNGENINLTIKGGKPRPFR